MSWRTVLRSLVIGGATLLVTLALRPPALAAQTPAPTHVVVPTVPPRPEDVASVEAMIKAFYDVISGPPGRPRQWARDRSLYVPGVTFVATGMGKRGPYAAIMDHQRFVDQTDSGFVHDGFYEHEIHRVTQTYGNIVHAFSTYEERRAPDGPVAGRGINSIELFWDGARWWIASAIWFSEDAQHPIPQEYLP
jgi:hypothetical protein